MTTLVLKCDTRRCCIIIHDGLHIIFISNNITLSIYLSCSSSVLFPSFSLSLYFSSLYLHLPNLSLSLSPLFSVILFLCIDIRERSCSLENSIYSYNNEISMERQHRDTRTIIQRHDSHSETLPARRCSLFHRKIIII